MKFRSKIYISFCLVALIPIILTGILVVWLSSRKMESIESAYDVKVGKIENMINPTKLYSMLTNTEMNEIEEMADSKPSVLREKSYLEKIDKNLDSKFSFLVVLRGKQIVYDGSGEGGENLVEMLRDESQSSYEGTLIMNAQGKEYIVRSKNVSFVDGTAGTVYIATEYGRMFPQLRALLIDSVLIMVLVLIICAVLLTFWLHMSVERPLRKLQKATKKIAEGNLDYELQIESKDEFGDLGKDFEEMRLRLKESAEQRVRDDNETKILISNISHDLKTPMTSIKGYVEGIMDGVADTPEKMDKYIRTIYNKVNDMDKLIGELTVYSKIDTNRLPYNFNKVNVNDYFSDCAEEMEIDLEQKNIAFYYSNTLKKPTLIIADAEQLKRVINNIINNSVKYIGKKNGEISLQLSENEEFVYVEITDNGKGIAVKDLPMIFDRFYRTDASRNSDQGGSGIGLSIAKKIIEDHGGRIWATSTLGIETTMHIELRKYREEKNDNGEE